MEVVAVLVEVDDGQWAEVVRRAGEDDCPPEAVVAAALRAHLSGREPRAVSHARPWASAGLARGLADVTEQEDDARLESYELGYTGADGGAYAVDTSALSHEYDSEMGRSPHALFVEQLRGWARGAPVPAGMARDFHSYLRKNSRRLY